MASYDDETADRILALVAERGSELRIVRCDGDRADLARYQEWLSGAASVSDADAGEAPGFLGWNVRYRPEPGDLLLSIYNGASSYAVDVAPVLSIDPDRGGRLGAALIDPDADILISPLLDMACVYAEMARPVPPRWRAPIAGVRAHDLMTGLATAVRRRPVFSHEEVRREVTRCNAFARSAKNREAAIIGSRGICAGCGLAWGSHFGDFALDAHHLRPLASLPGSQRTVTTKVTDLAVLCPTCHRIIHRQATAEAGADPLEVLQAHMRVFQSEAGRAESSQQSAAFAK